MVRATSRPVDIIITFVPVIWFGTLTFFYLSVGGSVIKFHSLSNLSFWWGCLASSFGKSNLSPFRHYKDTALFNRLYILLTSFMNKAVFLFLVNFC